MKKIKLYWIWLAVIMFISRVMQLCFLYLMNAPTGGPIVDRWYRFFPHTVVVELGVVAALVLLFAGVSYLLKGQKARKVWGIATCVISGVYIVSSGGDDELMRWMGQHLSLSFFTTYSNAASDLGLVGRIFIGGIGHFSLSISWAVFMIVAAVVLYRKCFYKWFEVKNSRTSYIALGLSFLLAVVGLSSKFWFAPSKMRWKRISPVFWHFGEDILYQFSKQDKPATYDLGISALGGDPSKEYPFWHEVQDEKASIEAFKEKKLENRPDIVLLVIETYRGWTGDVRIGSICELTPNICKLAKQGAYFPNARSVGYPSVEGFLGILAGVWSHPHSSFLSDFPNTKMRTLPDILGEAGYYREVLTATEPSFDNLNPWFAAWFDYSEYKPENQHDIPIGFRFKERYAARPLDKPLFFDWMSTSMHVPFTLPSEYGATPEDAEVAYLRTLAYMDSAVGLVVEEVAKGPRANNTLFIVVGDHAFGNNAQHSTPEYIGSAQDGYTWVPLIFAGPGVSQFVDSQVVSQVDIAPTIMSILGLNVSNNFVGKDLQVDMQDSASIRPAHPVVFAFRNEDVNMQEDSLTYYGNMDDDEVSSIFRTRFVPDWDTTHLVEGFAVGKKLENVPENAKSQLEKMRAAAKAWGYVVGNNRLKP